MDIICLIPFHWIYSLTETARFVFFVKVYRLVKATNLITV